MAILDRVAALRDSGREVWSLCAGEPSGGAPTDVRALARDLHASDDPLGYTGPLGSMELRRAVADHHRRWYGLDVDPSSVAITTGASGGFVLAFLAAYDAGDRVAVVRPGYPAYRNLLHALDLVPVDVAVGPEADFRLTTAALDAAVAAHGKLAGLVLASPANPTGSMLGRDQLADVAACAQSTTSASSATRSTTASPTRPRRRPRSIAAPAPGPSIGAPSPSRRSPSTGA